MFTDINQLIKNVSTLSDEVLLSYLEHPSFKVKQANSMLQHMYSRLFSVLITEYIKRNK